MKFYSDLFTKASTCVEFACNFDVDDFPSYYDTGVRNKIALDTLRHQFNEYRKEVFDTLLKSANADPASVHLLFELWLGHKNHGEKQYLSGVNSILQSCFYSSSSYITKFYVLRLEIGKWVELELLETPNLLLTN